MSRYLALAFLVTLAGVPGVRAAESTKLASPPPVDREATTPAAHPMSNIYDLFDNSLVRPATRVLDVARLARKVSRHPREAANVDAEDQVRLPSTWWQPRLGFRAVTVEQMLTGPGPGTGPAPGKWKVTKTKDQGVTLGFQIEDSRGDTYVVKFDHEGFPELGSSALAIGSRLFWAAGYNVPDDAVASFAFEDLAIAKDAMWVDSKHRKHPVTPEYLKKLLARVERQKDGRYRCGTSRFLSGKPLGPFQYQGRRRDDPEDRIPHELRRELRGLWVMCAWTNHSDARAPNSHDSYVSEHGRSFVRHHLIDFGSILGAGPIGKPFATGTEYYMDFGVATHQVLTAGLRPFRWEAMTDPRMPSVGCIESEEFDPESWRTEYPNPAFDERTERDVRWGARIIAGFTDEHIRAAVAGAKYSDPRAAAYVTQVLIERRDKIVSRWLDPRPSPYVPGEVVSR